jgi:serine/threonine protein phosphatase PrpC
MPAFAAQDCMHWRASALSDRGRVRRRNEDSFLIAPRARLLAVADGMGGHAAGDVASRIAIQTLEAAFARAPSPRIRAPALARRLLAAFNAANESILQHARLHRETSGMGTTLTTLMPLQTSTQAVIAHIGDSRAYRLRGGALVQLTRDHTWVQQQVEAGILSAVEARQHRLASVLSRVLGTEAMGPADTFIIDIEPGDRYLLCSDGLTNMLEDADLEAMLARAEPLDDIARQLIHAANLRGGHDNITAVLAETEAA